MNKARKQGRRVDENNLSTAINDNARDNVVQSLQVGHHWKSNTIFHIWMMKKLVV